MMNAKQLLFVMYALVLLPIQHAFAQGREPAEWQVIALDSLDGWSDPGNWWKAEDGMIVAESNGGKDLPKIHYLIWDAALPQDFELSLEYRITATEPADAGAHFRVERPIDPDSGFLKGYQAELDTANQFANRRTKKNEIRFIRQGMLFGNIHDGKRIRMFKRNQTTTIDADGKESRTPLPVKFIPARVYRTPPEWNTCRVHVEGPHIQLYMNDVLANEIIDRDMTQRSTGDAIALQFRPDTAYRFEVKAIQFRTIGN